MQIPIKKFAAYLIISIILTLGLSISLQSLLAAWTAPTASPPADNVNRPLYATSSVIQMINKQSGTGGSLGVEGNFSVGDDTYLAGNVGIGTNNPTQKLDIDSGNALIQGNSSYSAVGDRAYLYLGDIEAYISAEYGSGLKLGAWQAPDAFVIQQTTGNVGIGTNNPSQKLDVTGKIKSDLTTDEDPDNTVVTKSYVKSQTTYTVCSWYDGNTCPVVDSIQTLMAGYTSTQVQCCGKSGTICTPYGWTTYNSYCSASCAGVECGSVSGTRMDQQRKRDADCLMSYRTIDSGVYCSITCGTCPIGEFCSAGSCIVATTPYLFTYTKGQYLIENDIMNTFYQAAGMSIDEVKTAYEENNVSDKFEEKDSYKLLVKPEIKNNKIKLQIRELEPEESHIDEVQLIKVVHDKNSFAFADIPLTSGKNGAIHNLAGLKETAPISCQEDNGKNCLPKILDDDMQAVEKEAGGSVIITFNASGLNFNNNIFFYINAWGRHKTPRLINSPLEGGNSSSFNILYYYGQNGWSKAGRQMHPRAMMRSNALRGGNYIKVWPEYVGPDGKITLKFEWTEKHMLDKLSIISFDHSAKYKTEILPLLKAVHSRDGDVQTQLISKDFNYVHTVRGDIIDLEFSAGKLNPGQNETVDYFFVSTGYYHGLRTYLYPDVDTSKESFEKELNHYVEEYNNYMKFHPRALPYPEQETSQAIDSYLNSFNSYYFGQ